MPDDRPAPRGGIGLDRLALQGQRVLVMGRYAGIESYTHPASPPAKNPPAWTRRTVHFSTRPTLAHGAAENYSFSPEGYKGTLVPKEDAHASTSSYPIFGLTE